MAQSEYERGFLAGCHYMQREAVRAVLSVDISELREEKEAKQ